MFFCVAGDGTMTGIVPRGKTKGVDICGMQVYTYIIRSDLGCYMTIENLSKDPKISIAKLHPSCQNADHYVCDHLTCYFYIIKGKSFRKVTDLSTDDKAVVGELHPKFQGGDHYFSVSGSFFVIFKEKGICLTTKDLDKDSNTVEIKVHPNCNTGLYYWSTSDDSVYKGYRPQLRYFLKPTLEWGVEYCETEELTKEKPNVYSLHPDVVNFLPGGLSITQGPAIGRWEIIKTITNDSDSSMKWSQKIVKKVGYNKEKMKEIAHNWKIGASASIESGELAGLIAKVQFSLSAEYGGSHVSTVKENWDEATEVEENVEMVLEPDKSVYLWQYRLNLGDEPVLFCRDLYVDNDPNPPAKVPVAPANP